MARKKSKIEIPASAALTLAEPAWSLGAPRAWQAEAFRAGAAALAEGAPDVVCAVTGAGKSVLIAELAACTSGVVVVSTPTQSLVRQLAGTVGARCGGAGQYYADAKESLSRVVVTCNPSLLALLEEMRLCGVQPALLIVDEVHKSESPQILQAIQAINAWGWSVARIGLTATPFRSDPKEKLSAWRRLCFRYTLAEALRDGVLCPWRVVNWAGGSDGEINQVCADLIRGVPGPGIVSARSIEDAVECAAFLRAQGIPAHEIHSKQTAKEQATLIASLKAGGLRCLVHVALLVEGVDLPWLRWICMRRAVGSPVRFLQEIGRVLRVCAGKTLATVIDPHDLFGVLGIHHDPALGARELDAAVEGTPEERVGEAAERQPIPPAVAIDEITNWTRRLLLSLEAAGLARESRVRARHRGSPTSERQVRTLLGAGDRAGLARLVRYVPEPHKAALKSLCTEAALWHAQRGAVSDLIEVFKIIQEQTAEERRAWATGEGRGVARWSWPEGLEVEPVSPRVLAALPVSIPPLFQWREEGQQRVCRAAIGLVADGASWTLFKADGGAWHTGTAADSWEALMALLARLEALRAGAQARGSAAPRVRVELEMPPAWGLDDTRAAVVRDRQERLLKQGVEVVEPRDRPELEAA